MGQLVDHMPQRAQAPAQHQGLQQQQDDAGTTEVEPQRATEKAQLRAQRARVFHHVDGVRKLAGRITVAAPDQAQAIAVDLALTAIDLGHVQRAFEHLLARCQQAALVVRQQRPLGRHRIALPFGHHHFQVQATAGHVKARIRRLLTDIQRAVTGEVDPGRIGRGVVFQPLTQVVARGVGEGRIQRIAGQGQKGHQAGRCGQHLPRLQGAQPPAVKQSNLARHAAASSGNQPSLRGIAKRYPRPRTVSIGLSSPSASSFLRSRPMNTSSTLESRSKSCW